MLFLFFFRHFVVLEAYLRTYVRTRDRAGLRGSVQFTLACGKIKYVLLQRMIRIIKKKNQSRLTMIGYLRCRGVLDMASGRMLESNRKRAALGVRDTRRGGHKQHKHTTNIRLVPESDAD